MPHRLKTTVLVLIAGIAFSYQAPCANAAADSESELRIAVARLNSWLGADANARRWRQVLCLNILDAQAALGHRADAGALVELQGLFESDIPGLEHTVFQQTHQAIAAHLQQISRNYSDIPWTIEQSSSVFRQTSLDDLNRLRQASIYDINMLKRFYKTRLYSRQRALLYYELKPDESVEFLQGIEFEIPPERSRQVIESEIESLETEKKTIDAQIQNLNEQQDQIRKWLEGIENLRPEGVEPPGPDDDDQLDLNDSVDSAETQTGESPNPPANTGSAAQQQQLEALEAQRIVLQDSLDRIDMRIELLKQEVDELQKSERDRVGRFRDVLTSLNKYLAAYENLRTDRNDVYFGSAYNSLVTLKNAFLYAANPATETLFAAQMEKLKDARSLLAAANDRRAAADVGQLTGWLESAGQVNDLVAAIRTRHSLPNLYFDVSNQLINQFASRPVNEPQRVNEQILGRLIRGQADVNGIVAVAFQPDPYQVRAAIDFTGSIDSDTYTRTGRLTAYAGAHADFNVRRELFANIGGMFACDVQGDLQLGSYFKCIDSNLRLVQKIALKQYYKSKARSEAISRQRTIDKLFPRFEEQTDEAIAGGYDQFENLNQRQTDTGKVLPSLYLHTTTDRLVAVGHRATGFDLAATTPPSDYNFTPSDVVLKIHESMPSNYSSPLVAGKTLTNKQIAAQFQSVLGKSIAADDDQPGEEEDEFSITFDDARPIQFEFEGNILAVTISGKEFSREGDRIRNGLRIRFAFKIVNDGEQLTLVPESEVEIELINPERRNIKTVSFISFLKDRLTEVLGNAFENKVVLPQNLIPVENLEPNFKSVAEDLQLVQLRMDSGWLYTGWKYQPEEFTWSSMALRDTPALWPKTLEQKHLPDDDLDISELEASSE